MLDENKILEIARYFKSTGPPFLIHANLQSLIKKQMDVTTIQNNYIIGYLMSMICAFDDTKNEHDVCREKDCMKKSCLCLKEHAIEIINS